VTAYALDGFAFAAETLVGQAIGARDRRSLRGGAILTSGWGGVICLGLSLGFWMFGPQIIDVMTTAPDVREAARKFLPFMALAPLVGIVPWMLDGIFIGATRTRDMRNMMMISAVAYFAVALPLMGAYGNQGLWAALLISFAVRGLTLGLRYPALERSVEG